MRFNQDHEQLRERLFSLFIGSGYSTAQAAAELEAAFSAIVEGREAPKGRPKAKKKAR